VVTNFSRIRRCRSTKTHGCSSFGNRERLSAWLGPRNVFGLRLLTVNPLSTLIRNVADILKPLREKGIIRFEDDGQVKN
jgi:predicted transcriptional regulator